MEGSKWWYSEPPELARYTLDEVIDALEQVERIRETSRMQKQALEYLKQYRELLVLIDQWQRSAVQKWPEK